MPKIEKRATVPYSVEQMFDLVNDVPGYPQFIPWCRQSSVKMTAQNQVLATLVFAAGPLDKHFTTCNTLNKPHAIHMVLEEGPFKDLDGAWEFKSTPEGCEVSLSLSLHYKNRLVQSAIGMIFEQAVAKMMPCFVARAEEVYGKH